VTSPCGGADCPRTRVGLVAGLFLCPFIGGGCRADSKEGFQNAIIVRSYGGGAMGTTETGVLNAKAGLRRGFGYIRCSNPGCDHILFEASKRAWNTNRIERMLCPTCGHSTSLIAFLQSENDAGELIVRYWCCKCDICFERTMIGIRKYCTGCHTYQNIYFTLSLAISGEIPVYQATAAET